MNTQSKKRMKIFALGFAAGLLIFFAIYGFNVVNVQNDSCLINGYIEKDIEDIVALQTDAPLKRAILPFGGSRIVEKSCEAYGR